MQHIAEGDPHWHGGVYVEHPFGPDDDGNWDWDEILSIERSDSGQLRFLVRWLSDESTVTYDDSWIELSAFTDERRVWDWLNVRWLQKPLAELTPAALQWKELITASCQTLTTP